MLKLGSGGARLTRKGFCISMLRTIFSKQFFITLLLVALVAVFAVPLTKNWRQKHEIDKEVADLEAQVNELEHKNSSLKQVLDYMKSDQFVEHEARTKLNYKKPGEDVVVIENKPGGDESTTTSSAIFSIPPAPPTVSTEPHLLGNIDKWLNYFFKKK